MSDIANKVKNDIERRAQKGKEEYGERLRPNNGRDPLNDLYEELLDAAMYARQMLEERYK